jgi:hypothetical protein
MLDVLSHMRLIALLLVAIAVGAPARAQEPQTTSNPPTASPSQDELPKLPVSIDRIKGALSQTPAVPLIRLDDKPHFKVDVLEKQKIRIEDLISTMDFRSGPAVPGGVYGYEQNRLAHPTVDNPLQQPYSAFSQSELLTIVIENLAGKYLGGKALSAVSAAEAAHAEQAARNEVERALAEFWAAQKGPYAPTTPKQ